MTRALAEVARALLGRLSHLLRYLLRDRLPDSLLVYGELSDFVWCHRLHIGAELSEFLPDPRVAYRLAKIRADLLQNRVRRAYGCQQHVPAPGHEVRQCFRDRRQFIEIIQSLER